MNILKDNTFFFVAALVKPPKLMHVHVFFPRVQYHTISATSTVAENCHRLTESGCDDRRQILQALGNLRVIIIFAAVS